jgi:hypothetical protein
MKVRRLSLLKSKGDLQVVRTETIWELQEWLSSLWGRMGWEQSSWNPEFQQGKMCRERYGRRLGLLVLSLLSPSLLSGGTLVPPRNSADLGGPRTLAAAGMDA